MENSWIGDPLLSLLHAELALARVRALLPPPKEEGTTNISTPPSRYYPPYSNCECHSPIPGLGSSLRPLFHSSEADVLHEREVFRQLAKIIRQRHKLKTEKAKLMRNANSNQSKTKRTPFHRPVLKGSLHLLEGKDKVDTVTKNPPTTTQNYTVTKDLPTPTQSCAATHPPIPTIDMDMSPHNFVGSPEFESTPAKKTYIQDTKDDIAMTGVFAFKFENPIGSSYNDREACADSDHVSSSSSSTKERRVLTRADNLWQRET
jgi:hypothetical protein